MEQNGRRFFWCVVLATTVLHVVIAVATPVSGDEAYYWDCSRHLDWSYFDQPPLVIWAMVPFRALLGETKLAVRAPAVVASLLIAVGLLGVVRRLGGTAGQAGLAYLLLHGTPLVLLGSSYASTDIAMIAAFTLATWAAMAVADGELRAWWGFGTAIGLGFLAKFPMVLALATILAAVAWGDGRRHLRRATPYLAALWAVALTAPVWIWAVQHDWVNILFQLAGRHRSTGFTMRYLGEYLGANLLLLSPPLAVALALAWWAARRRREPGWRVAVVAAVTPFAFFGLLALRSRMSPHWGLPGLVVAAAVLVLVPVRWRRGLVIAGVAFGLLLSATVLAAVAFPERLLELEWTYSGRPGRVSTSAAADIIGYDEIIRDIGERLQPGELVASSSYTLTHLLAFRSGGRLDTRLADVDRGRHGLASLYWYEPDELRGRDVLFVTASDRPRIDARLAAIFGSVEAQPPIEVVRRGRIVRRLRVLRCRDLLEPVPALTRMAVPET
ncbi:MAG: glycosyltransferase family 39 protein [Holophagae bacterium]